MDNSDKIPVGKGLLQQIEGHSEYVNMHPTKEEWDKMWSDLTKQMFRSDKRLQQFCLGKGLIEYMSDDEFVAFVRSYSKYYEFIMGYEAYKLFNERCERLHDRINPPKKQKPKTVQNCTKLYNHSQPWKKKWKR